MRSLHALGALVLLTATAACTSTAGGGNGGVPAGNGGAVAGNGGAGTTAGGAGGMSSGDTPTTCTATIPCGQVECGPVSYCGSTFDCPCPNQGTCVAGHCQPSDCVPKTCAEQGFECGVNGDGCGNAISCGSCPPGKICGAGGHANHCG